MDQTSGYIRGKAIFGMLPAITDRISSETTNRDEEVSVHLAYRKPHRPLGKHVLGKLLLPPTLDYFDSVQLSVGMYEVDMKWHSPGKYAFRHRLKGCGPDDDLVCRAHENPHGQDLIPAYGVQTNSTKSRPQSKNISSDQRPSVVRK